MGSTRRNVNSCTAGERKKVGGCCGGKMSAAAKQELPAVREPVGSETVASSPAPQPRPAESGTVEACIIGKAVLIQLLQPRPAESGTAEA